MGCGMSTEDKEGKQRNEEIENQLKKDRMMQRNEIKMLLLGTLFPPLQQKKNKKKFIQLTSSYRRRRIGQVYHSQTDEAHP